LSVVVLPLVEGCVDEVELLCGLFAVVDEDWELLVFCVVLAVEFTSVDVWFADVELLVVLLPLPMFTPGLTFAPTFRSLLLMPTFASTPTFGFTLSVRLPAFVSEEVALEGVELVEPEMPLVEPDVPLAEPDRPPVELEALAALPEGTVLPVLPVVVALGDV